MLVEVRKSSGPPHTALPDPAAGRLAALVTSDGRLTGSDDATTPRFSMPYDDDLYMVVMHRNHLPVMSSQPLTRNGDTFTWNFTTGANQAYGSVNACTELAPGIWGLTGGDGNADGQVQNGDKNDARAAEAGSTGYMKGDFNMDSDVNNGDKNDLLLPNFGLGSQVPDSVTKRVASSGKPD
ncbi:MAG: hypothetical protein JW861_07045 [Bacteroidales bacterium]|nr:hypothetical protein [Bacteroidales bacterium]